MSSDSVESHQKFKKKYSIPFTLLVDADKKLRDAFGAGSRSTFLFGTDGTIRKVWPKVNVEGHGEDVLESL